MYDVEPYVPSGGEYKAHLYDESTDALVDSSEAFDLLTACFRELRKSSSVLRKISIPNKEARPLVSTALELAQFDSKVVPVSIDAHVLRGDDGDRFYRPVSASSRLIKADTFTTEGHEHFLQTRDSRKMGLARNEQGRHYRHYEPAGPRLANLVTRVGNVERLEGRYSLFNTEHMALNSSRSAQVSPTPQTVLGRLALPEARCAAARGNLALEICSPGVRGAIPRG